MIRPIHARNSKEERENAIVDRALGRWRTWLGPSGVLVGIIVGAFFGFLLLCILGAVILFFGMDTPSPDIFEDILDLVARWLTVSQLILISFAAGAIVGVYHSLRTSIKSERERMAREEAIPQCACGYSLEGNTTGVCPECGAPHASKP